jgi:DNA-directed RNA polymerase specialized sigma subunit
VFVDRRKHTQPSAELVLRAKAGEVDARDALIGELTPLVASVARMYRDRRR